MIALDSFEIDFDEALKLIKDLEVTDIVYAEQICTYILFVKNGEIINFRHTQCDDWTCELLLDGKDFGKLLDHFGIPSDVVNGVIYPLDGSKAMYYDALTGERSETPFDYGW